MPEYTVTGKWKMHWLNRAVYDNLPSVDPYALYWIKDQNIIFRGDKPLLDNFAEVSEFADPCVGPIKPKTLCYKISDVEGQPFFEARILNEQYGWDTVVPPVNGVIEKEGTEDKTLPTSNAVRTFVTDRLDELREYFDALNNSMTEKLERAQQAAVTAADAATDANISADDSFTSAIKSESYAVGGTDSRPGENTDNAKWYKQKAEEAASQGGGSAEEARQYAEAAAQSASEALDSEHNAATSETNAAASERAAAQSEANASASETAAQLSEHNAAASETAAHNSEVAAKASEDAAALSEQHASTSETNAHNSEVAAKQSEQAASTSETNAHNSEVAAKQSEQSAATSETNAHNSEVAAKASEDAAKRSEQNAASSESNAATSETNAHNSEVAAAGSETNAHNSEVAAANSAAAALVSEGKAKTSETNAKASEDAAKLSETNAHNSEVAAAGSETNAHNSEVAAAGSASAALTSEQHALASEQAAAGSASAALTSEQHALASEQAAAGSAAAALASEQHASTSEGNASNSAAAALTSEQHASASETAAANSATLAESWAVGGTDTRAGEDENNAKYYAELAEHFSPAGKADKPNPLPEENGHLAEVNTEGNLVTSDLKSADVAKKDGYYAAEGLGAATAEQIIDPNATPEAATFGFRTSAGDLSITDGTGVVHTQEGSTEIINQIVAPTNENTVTGVSTVQVTDAVAGTTKGMTLTAPKSVVINQLATATQDTVATGTGVVEVEHSSQANANALTMTAQRSVVVNQLVQNGDFSDGTNNWTGYNTTVSVVNGVGKVVYNTSGNKNISNSFNSYVYGHTYLLSVEVKVDTEVSPVFTTGYIQGCTTTGERYSDSGCVGQWKRYTTKNVADVANATYKTYFLNWNSGDYAAEVYIKNAMIVDLTQYFNGDTTLINSITSWADLVAYDPRFAQYVEYNTGTVKGVQPTVKVTGKNLLNIGRELGTLSSGSGNTEKRFFDYSKYYVGLSSGNYYYPSRVGSYSISGDTISGTVGSQNSGYGVDFPFEVIPGATYTISVETNTNSRLRVSYYTATGNVSSTAGPLSSDTHVSFTVPRNCVTAVVHFYGYTTGVSWSVTKPQLEYGSTATSYEPYHDGGTAQAPAPLFAVGNAADEHEAVAGVTTRKIGSYTFTGNETVYLDTYYPVEGYYFATFKKDVFSNNIRNDFASSVVGNLLFSELQTKSNAQIINTTKPTQGVASGSGDYAVIFRVVNSIASNSTEFLAWLAGKTIYYELATPTTSTSTSTQISLQAGNNIAMQTDGGRLATLALNYPATVYTKQLLTSRTYLHKHGSTVTKISNSSSVELDGSDQLVDLTQLFNNDTTTVAAVSTWNDLVAQVPAYAATMAYNAGVVTGAVPAVKIRGKNWYSEGTRTFTGTSGRLSCVLEPGTYTISAQVTSTATTANALIAFYFVNGSPYASSTSRLVISNSRSSITVELNYKVYEIVFYAGDNAANSNGKTATWTDPQIAPSVVSQKTVYEPYFNGGTVTAPSTLYCVGTAADTFNAVTGKTNRVIGSVDLGTLTFSDYAAVDTSHPYGYTYAPLSSKKVGGLNVMTANYETKAGYGSNKTIRGQNDTNRIYINDDSFVGMTGAQIASALSGTILYYELATPTEETSEAQPTSFQNGINIISQSSTDLPGVSISAKYDGTNYNLKLINGSKYIVIDNGTTTYLTASSSNNPLPVVGGQTQVINLTQWFGKGYEPTLDNFYKRYPSLKGYTMSYTPGQVLNYKGTGIRTVGFNAYNSATGTAVLLGGNKYQICGTYTSVSYVDRWGNTEELDLDEEGIFTPVNDGTLTVTGGNATDTCVHLTWSGYKNYGKEEYQWEPYWQVTTDLPVATYFPDGMNGIRFNNGGENIADVYDELTITGYVKRVDKADLSTLIWTWKTTTDGGYWKSSSIGSVIKRPRTSAILPHIICTTYINHISGQWGGSSSYEGYITVDSGAGELRVNNGSTTITPTGILYYELATPVTVTFPEAVRVSYPISDFGTEELIPAYAASGLPTTTWLDGKIQYQQDFTRLLINYSKIYSVVKHLADTADHLVYDDSTAPNLIAGNAYNLIDREAQGTLREFSYDSVNGTNDVTDGTAIAQAVYGQSLMANQLVKDSISKTTSGTGQVEVEDAVAGNISSLVVEGRSLVKNQLVPDTKVNTKNSVDGVIGVTDAVAGNATSLVMTAPRSVVVNQLVQNGNFNDGTTGWTPRNNTTISATSNILTANVSDTNVGSVAEELDVQINSGRAYCLHVEVKTSAADTVKCGAFSNSVWHFLTTVNTTSDTWTQIDIVTNANGSSVGSPTLSILFNYGGSTSSVQIRNVQLVDLTQYFNGNTTLINSITSWDDLVAYDPRFANYVAYNTGTVTGVTPQVTVTDKTGLTSKQLAPRDVVMNQLVQNGNFETNDWGNTSIASSSVSNGVLSFTVNAEAGYKSKPLANAIANHTYLYTVEVKSPYTGVGIHVLANYSTQARFMITSSIVESGTFGRIFGKWTPASNKGNVYFKLIDTKASDWQELQFKNAMCIDLTQYFNGDTDLINSITSWDDLVAYDSAFANYVTYNTGTTKHIEPYGASSYVSPVELLQINDSITDSFDAVTGKTTTRISSYTFTGQETITQITAASSGVVYYQISGNYPGKQRGWTNVWMEGCYRVVGHNANISSPYDICGHGTVSGLVFIGNQNCTTQEDFITWLTGKTFYYQLSTPVVTTTTTDGVPLVQGTNNLVQTDGGRTTPFTLDYTGTEFTLPLDSTHKYAFSDNGTKSIITGSSEQAVTGGQDMLVDVTRMFNGVTADINAITSWADMAAVMPTYNSTVAYNEGEVVGRSGGVTTAKWNQFAPAFSLDGTTLNLWGGSSSVTCVVNGNTSATFTATTASIIGISSMLRNVTGHKVFCQAYVTANAEKSNYFFYLYNNYFGSDVTWTVNQRTRCACILNCTTTSSYTFGFRVQADTTMTVEDLMFIDLTLIYGAGHEPSTVEEFEADCLKWGKDLSQYQPYDAGTPMGGSATFSALHGVGNVKDTQDVITGEKTVKMASVDLGTLSAGTYHNADGNYPYGYTYVDIPDKHAGTGNLICSGYLTNPASFANDRSITGNNSTASRIYIINSAFTGMSGVEIKAALSGVMLYYELITPTATTETPQPLTVANGFNIVHEADMSITGTTLAMTYTGTDQTLVTDTSRKYLQRINGVDEVVENVASIDVVGVRDRVIDLTYMFGAGNEPATAADFYKLFPTWQGYAIPYNKGSLVNFKGTGLKSVGFNLLDIESRTEGEPQYTNSAPTTVRGVFDETKYYCGFDAHNRYTKQNAVLKTKSATEISVAGSQGYGVGFPIKVIPGQVYLLESPASTVRMVFYTYNGTRISYASADANNSVIAPANAYWGMILVFSSQSGVIKTWTNPCVHLQWSGGRNGDYEPYWDFTRQLPTLTYFPDGMNGVGQVHDEITSRQAIKRLTEVDLEDLTWTEGAGTWTTTLTGVKSNTTAIAVPNSYSYSLSGTSLTITSDVSPTGKLVYELSTPVTTTFAEEAAVTAQVSDYGTESVVPVNGYELITAPFLGIVKYQDNYARTITKLPENYQSQNSMDNLQVVLSTLLNVTLTSSYDAEHQDYDYTVTGDGVPGLIAAALTALAPVTGLTFLGNSYTPTEGVVALPDPRVQSITTIPASTSSYTLTEGNFEHYPNLLPTYTLPEVTDTSVVHTIKLTVKMSANVLTVNFKNSNNVTVVPESVEGTVRSGTVVEYFCKYEPLASEWVIVGKVVTQTEPPSDEIWYTADSQVTLYSSTGVESHTFSDGKGVVKFTSNLTTVSQTLSGTPIKSVSIPSSVTSLGNSHCFENCTSLRDVNLSSSVVTIGQNCFNGCSELVNINWPTTLTTISDNAFSGCTKLAAPELPNSVTSISTNAFINCANITWTSLPSNVALNYGSFTGCSKLALTSLPSNLTSLPANCFNGCTALALTELPSGLTTIKYYALRDCSNITITALPSGLSVIEQSAFSGCPKIKLTEVPASVTKMESSAFTACYGLNNITFKGTPTSLASSVFNNCSNLTVIKVPWAQGAVDNAPWGATRATITYNYTA